MKPKWLLSAGWVVSVLGMGAGIVFLHHQNTRLRERFEDVRRPGPSAAAMRADNERLRRVVAQIQTDASGRALAVQAEVARLRAAVAEQERKADLQHAQLVAQETADAAALAGNRDPQRGLARLEYFQNVGRATPAAAVQTLVWAALKGDASTLAEDFVLSNAARTNAEELIRALPPGGRDGWTPEKIAALFFTGTITDVAAAQIGDERIGDAGRATVRVRIPGVAPEKSLLTLQLGVNGWQVVVSEREIDAVRRRMASAVPAP